MTSSTTFVDRRRRSSSTSTPSASDAFGNSLPRADGGWRSWPRPTGRPGSSLRTLASRYKLVPIETVMIRPCRENRSHSNNSYWEKMKLSRTSPGNQIHRNKIPGCETQQLEPSHDIILLKFNFIVGYYLSDFL